MRYLIDVELDPGVFVPYPAATFDSLRAAEEALTRSQEHFPRRYRIRIGCCEDLRRGLGSVVRSVAPPMSQSNNPSRSPS